jgi:hypothetical protein
MAELARLEPQWGGSSGGEPVRGEWFRADRLVIDATGVIAHQVTTPPDPFPERGAMGRGKIGQNLESSDMIMMIRPSGESL